MEGVTLHGIDNQTYNKHCLDERSDYDEIRHSSIEKSKGSPGSEYTDIDMNTFNHTVYDELGSVANTQQLQSSPGPNTLLETNGVADNYFILEKVAPNTAPDPTPHTSDDENDDYNYVDIVDDPGNSENKRNEKVGKPADNTLLKNEYDILKKESNLEVINEEYGCIEDKIETDYDTFEQQSEQNNTGGEYDSMRNISQIQKHACLPSEKAPNSTTKLSLSSVEEHTNNKDEPVSVNNPYEFAGNPANSEAPNTFIKPDVIVNQSNPYELATTLDSVRPLSNPYELALDVDNAERTRTSYDNPYELANEPDIISSLDDNYFILEKVDNNHDFKTQF